MDWQITIALLIVGFGVGFAMAYGIDKLDQWLKAHWKE